MKSAAPADVENLFGNLTKKEVTPMAAEEVTAPTQEDYDALVAKAADLEATNATLVADLAKATAPKEESPEEALLKSVPEAVRLRLEKAEADNLAVREDLAKERDARLDAAAVVESQGMFKSLAFDHSVVAPALRRLAVISPAVSEAVTTVLKAAEGQLESAGIFQELGKAAPADLAKSAMERIKEASAVLKAATPSLSDSEAFTKAVEADPSLYTDYLEGK